MLVREALDKLLSILDSDLDDAGRKYELLREKLIKYFCWQSCAYPEELADRAIDRIVEKINEGEKIQNISGYALKVARYIFLEQQRECKNSSLDELSAAELPASECQTEEAQWVVERKYQCLERCLDNLPHREHVMITGYYQGEKRAKIENREQLALRLGLSANALTIKVHRIKEQLRKCIGNCLQGLED